MSRPHGGFNWPPSGSLGDVLENALCDSSSASADHSNSGHLSWPFGGLKGSDDDELASVTFPALDRPALLQPYQNLQEGLQDLTLYPRQDTAIPGMQDVQYAARLLSTASTAAKRSAVNLPRPPPNKRRLRPRAAKENVPAAALGKAGTPCFDTWTPSDPLKGTGASRGQQPLAVLQPFAMLKGQADVGCVSLKDINSRLCGQAQGSAFRHHLTPHHQPQAARTASSLVQLVGPTGPGLGGPAGPASGRVLAGYPQLRYGNISVAVVPGPPMQRLGPLKLQ